MKHTRSMTALVAGLLILVAGLVACKTTQPTSVQLEDSEIEAKIASKIAADPELNPFEIDVVVNEGVVRLYGTVDDEGDAAAAARLARATEGVTRVVNEITYGEDRVSGEIDDATILTAVKTKLTGDPQVNPLNVEVDVQDGVVYLNGRVEQAADKAEAERLAESVDGVVRVENNLEVGDL